MVQVGGNCESFPEGNRGNIEPRAGGGGEEGRGGGRKKGEEEGRGALMDNKEIKSNL